MPSVNFRISGPLINGNINVQYNGNKIFRDYKMALADGLEKATKLYYRKILEGLNIWGSVSFIQLRRAKLKAKGFPRVGRRFTVRRSKPGQAPFRQSSELRRSTQFEISRQKLKAYIFNVAIYALALERGYPPRNLLPRPLWVKTFNRYYNVMLAHIVNALHRL